MNFGRLFIRLAIVAVWIFLFFALLTATHVMNPFKKEKEVLNIFSWPEVLSPEIIKKFEKETGIVIKRHYYTSNEELLIKLKATQGAGYDLIIPSDYAVTKLTEENLLQPIDHSKLNFVEHLNPKLMRQPFDPENTYSIPFIWEVTGFGVNTDQFQILPFEPTWKEIFNPTHPDMKISMINDPIEAIDMTAHHLFGVKKELSSQDLALIQSTLYEQKPVIEAYAGVRGDYLLTTKNCSVAVIPSSYVMRAAKNCPHIDFIIPEDYTFITIENICIPKHSEKTELTYTFLNYLFQGDVLAEETKIYHNFPATTNAIPDDHASPIYLKTLKALENYEGTYFYFRELFPEKDSRSLWVKLKSH